MSPTYLGTFDIPITIGAAISPTYSGAFDIPITIGVAISLNTFSGFL
jgi:hypothetical protein